MKQIFRALALLLAFTLALAFPALAAHAGTDKITICHATGSEKNPYVEITISEEAANGGGKNDHTSHAGDIIPAPAEGCPGPVAEPAPEEPEVPVEPPVEEEPVVEEPVEPEPVIEPPVDAEPGNGNGCPRPFKGSANRVLCPEPVEEPAEPEQPAPVEEEPVVEEPVKEEPVVAEPVVEKPVKPVAPKEPVVEDKPFVGPVVDRDEPAKPFVGPVVADTNTVAVANELPYTGAYELMLLYVGIMFLGMGVLCYTVPVALTSGR